MQGYCVKCKAMQKMKNAKFLKKLKNGCSMSQGNCSKCGTKVNAIQKKSASSVEE